MRHINRDSLTVPVYDDAIKHFHNLRNIEAVNNHKSLKCLDIEGPCPKHSTDQSYLMHFRVERDFPSNCNKSDEKENVRYMIILLLSYYNNCGNIITF